MATTLKIKYSATANEPLSLVEGELGFVSSTKQLFIGTNKGEEIVELTSLTGDLSNFSIADLGDVLSSMSPLDGQVLTYDSVNGWQSETSPVGVTDHLLLSNIGTNSHPVIDAHIADGTIHFTQAGISITESQISDFGSYALAIHNHTGFYEPVFAKNTGFNKDFGTTVGTVSEGNHNHDADYANIVHTHVMSDITNSTWISNITGQSIKNLSDVFSTMTPTQDQVLTYDSVNGWQAADPQGGTSGFTGENLVDYISDLELYRGEAEVGSLPSASVWRIRHIVINSDASASTTTWASGTELFDKIWDDRLLYIYS